MTFVVWFGPRTMHAVRWFLAEWVGNAVILGKGKADDGAIHAVTQTKRHQQVLDIGSDRSTSNCSANQTRRWFLSFAGPTHAEPTHGAWSGPFKQTRSPKGLLGFRRWQIGNDAIGDNVPAPVETRLALFCLCLINYVSANSGCSQWA
jgi:phenylpropionate dioxygenase-like ring-hydroxylating dioxygenase large terminal subunit